MAAYYEQAAAEEHPGALNQDGSGPSRRGAGLLQRSLDAGYDGALVNLGDLAGLAGDLELATELHRRAAHEGYPNALYNLGRNDQHERAIAAWKQSHAADDRECM